MSELVRANGGARERTRSCASERSHWRPAGCSSSSTAFASIPVAGAVAARSTSCLSERLRVASRAARRHRLPSTSSMLTGKWSVESCSSSKAVTSRRWRSTPSTNRYRSHHLSVFASHRRAYGINSCWTRWWEMPRMSAASRRLRPMQSSRLAAFAIVVAACCAASDAALRAPVASLLRKRNGGRNGTEH